MSNYVTLPAVGVGTSTPRVAANLNQDNAYVQHTMFGDSYNLDAFHRLRISSPLTLWDTMAEYGVNSYKESTKVVGGSVSRTANQPVVLLSTGGTASGNYAIRQSRYYMRYQPGKSQYIGLTWRFGTARSNAVSRAGYFDDSDGIFFQRDGSTYGVVRRTSTSGTPVDNVVTRSNWNIDKLDGTGQSGIDLSLDSLNCLIGIIDLQLLYVGRARLGFMYQGNPYYVHQFDGGSLQVPYMAYGTLPVRWEVRNTGVADGTLTMDSICGVCCSEGGFEGTRAHTFSCQNTTAVTAASGTLTPILTLRANATGPGSLANRGHIIPTGVDVLVTGNSPVRWRLIRNATLTGASFTNIDATKSLASFDVAATSYTGGEEIECGFCPSSNSTKGVTSERLFSDNPIIYDLLNSAGDTLTLVAAGIGGSSTTLAGFSWSEHY